MRAQTLHISLQEGPPEAHIERMDELMDALAASVIPQEREETFEPTWFEFEQHGPSGELACYRKTFHLNLGMDQGVGVVLTWEATEPARYELHCASSLKRETWIAERSRRLAWTALIAAVIGIKVARTFGGNDETLIVPYGRTLNTEGIVWYALALPIAGLTWWLSSAVLKTLYVRGERARVQDVLLTGSIACIKRCLDERSLTYAVVEKEPKPAPAIAHPAQSEGAPKPKRPLRRPRPPLQRRPAAPPTDS
ncbi:MAG: hypothetical protein KIS92_04645 [Planctomycetota bacterium]|nr:hypothetical protein [Planctomycetota bacterium]